MFPLCLRKAIKTCGLEGLPSTHLLTQVSLRRISSEKNNMPFINALKRDAGAKKIKNNEVIIAGLDGRKQVPVGSACLIVYIIYGFIMNQKQFTAQLFSEAISCVTYLADSLQPFLTCVKLIIFIGDTQMNLSMLKSVPPLTHTHRQSLFSEIAASLFRFF